MRLLFALALLLTPVVVKASAPDELVEIRQGEPVTIRSDRAYLLLRIIRPEDVPAIEPVLMRVPSTAEMDRYHAAKRAAFLAAEPEMIRQRERQIRRRQEASAAVRALMDEVPPVPSLETFNFPYFEVLNVQTVNGRQPFVRGRPESTYVVEATPGDYVLYGASFSGGDGALGACMCLGTVGFSARAGTVTDLGYFFGDRVHTESVIPELRPESGFGPSSYGSFVLLGATVRPVRPDSSVPEALRGISIVPAQYRAIGKFFDPRAVYINRMVPVPGVLDYDGARVIDVQSGSVVPDNLVE